MLNESDFYSNYDQIIPLVCKPYYKFIKKGVSVIPSNIKSICDLGIGTGNFIFIAKKKFPKIKLYGMDINPQFLQYTKKGLDDLIFRQGDINSADLPKADFFISSLTLHHIPFEFREEILLKTVKYGKGFINFDFFLWGKKTKNDAIREVLNFSKKSFKDKNSLDLISNEIKVKDYPFYLEDEKRIYESNGFRFDLIDKAFPFALYFVSLNQ